MAGRPPTQLDATFGELAAHWLEPTRHPDWSESYSKKVASTTTNWLLAHHITVEVGRNGRAARVPLAAVRLEDLTAAMALDALAHVRCQRAHGTYRTVHECLTAILNWGVTIRWIPVGYLDISDINELVRVVAYCNQLPVHPRHPYAGELVFTAFSGSHQDAINKGFHALRRSNSGIWDIPYLPIDPHDIGRSYEAVIRINSQTGNVRLSLLMEQRCGRHLVSRCLIVFCQAAQ